MPELVTSIILVVSLVFQKYVSNPEVASSIAVSPSHISISNAPLLISTLQGGRDAQGPGVQDVTPNQFKASQSLLYVMLSHPQTGSQTAGQIIFGLIKVESIQVGCAQGRNPPGIPLETAGVQPTPTHSAKQ